MQQTAIIALGSNLGDSREILERAIGRLEQLSGERLVRSSLWRSTPVGCPPGAGDFVNAVVGIKVNETPERLLQQLQELEREFGRRPKKVVNEARPLDLDLITLGDEVRQAPELMLPHPRAHLRKFVLEPLAEIAPRLVLPGQTKTVRELLSSLRTDEVVKRLTN